MNLADTLTQINVFDVVVILYLFGWFILGFIQGTIRRLLGIGALVFSFFLALQLNAIWLGGFLSANWTQYPKEYSIMIGYLVIFVAAVVAFTLLIQGTYKKAPLFAKFPVVDEIVGGLLGILQGFLLLLFITILLDQYYLYTNISQSEGEIAFLRTFWNALNDSEHRQHPPRHGDPGVHHDLRAPHPDPGTRGLQLEMTAGPGGGRPPPGPPGPSASVPAPRPFPRARLEADTLAAARALIGARLVRDG